MFVSRSNSKHRASRTQHALLLVLFFLISTLKSRREHKKTHVWPKWTHHYIHTLILKTNSCERWVMSISRGFCDATILSRCQCQTHALGWGHKACLQGRGLGSIYCIQMRCTGGDGTRIVLCAVLHFSENRGHQEYWEAVTRETWNPYTVKEGRTRLLVGF